MAAFDGISEQLDGLLSHPLATSSAALAWEPQLHWRRSMLMNAGDSRPGAASHDSSSNRPAFISTPPPTRLYAKSVRERIDRKWMWLVPPCNHANLTLSIPSRAGRADGDMATRLQALSYFAMVSPGARLRHVIDGQMVDFHVVQGSFLAQSWGYLQRWHLLRKGEVEIGAKHTWSLCTDTFPGAKCIGWRCGLEFKMPMRTAAVGWFLTMSL